MVTFADMDGDGMMDAVLYNKAMIYVYYNKLRKKEYVSTISESFLCLLQSETDKTSVFDSYNDIIFEEHIHDGRRFGGNEWVTIQNLQNTTRQPIDGLAPVLSTQQEGRIRSGDMDIDGFPDLFLTLNLLATDGSKYRRNFLLTNEECTAATCNTAAT